MRQRGTYDRVTFRVRLITQRSHAREAKIASEDAHRRPCSNDLDLIPHCHTHLRLQGLGFPLSLFLNILSSLLLLSTNNSSLNQVGQSYPRTNYIDVKTDDNWTKDKSFCLEPYTFRRGCLSILVLNNCHPPGNKIFLVVFITNSP